MNAVASGCGSAYYGVMEMAKKLTRLLKDRRMSRRELARAAEVSPGTVQNACNGSDMWLSNAVRVVRVLGVSLDYLADDAQDDPPAPLVSAEQAQMLEVLESIGIASPIALMRYIAGRTVPDVGSQPGPPPPSGPSLRPLAVRALGRPGAEPGGLAGGVPDGNDQGHPAHVPGRRKPEPGR